MSQKDKWSEEYSKLLNDNELKSRAEILVKTFEHILEQKNIKASLTMRLKGLTSLKEKIKRNEMDEEPLFSNKSIIEVLDDMIGIRIICMKIADEDKILQILKASNQFLLEERIDIQNSLEKQPQSQKNGHSIYRIKGKIEERFMFELQIKSLANLFWGEMEHLLIYKNNKYLINSTYYKNEMESIYKELEIIDDKLTDMEKIMTSESLEYDINEKKEILKRIMYLNLKEHFREVHEKEYLNNNYIFDGIANIVFADIKDRRNQKMSSEEKYNEIFENAITLFLNRNKCNFSFKQFSIEKVKTIAENDNEIHKISIEIMDNRRNGWWYMFLIISIIFYNKEHTEFEGKNITWNEIEPYFVRTAKSIELMIQIKMSAPMDDCAIFADGNKSLVMTRIIALLKQKQFYSFSKNKDMRWTDKKFQNLYKDNSTTLLSYLRENIGCGMEAEEIEENMDHIEHISNNLVEILRDTGINNANIKSYINDVNLQLKDMGILPLDLNITGETKVTVQDVIKQIESKKVGADHE